VSLFKGALYFDVHASGHTAFAESLQLRIDISPNVRVIRDDTGLKSLALSSRPNWPTTKFTPAIDLAKWVDTPTLAPGIARTLTAAEDAQFWRHKGFDPRGFERAMVYNLKVGTMARGGSTLSQQVIKNIFLTGERTIARKLQEVVLTWMMERALTKTRILELYLNIAEWGPGARGLEQAARLYFNRSAQALQPEHMALLGTILPSPKRFGAHIKAGRLPSSRLTKFEHVASNLRFLGEIEPSTYTQWMADIKRGRVAGLKLTLCADDDTAPPKTPSCPKHSP
jgi:membrane peptidoglycan carboxypeptidase